jgi:hypothetical protein
MLLAKTFEPYPAIVRAPCHPVRTMSLTFAFDIGYASIGWCVLSAPEKAPADPEIRGTGVVTFPTDDCLASTRRDLRRTRRHIRSTRMRIERMKRWLQHRGVLSRQDLDRPGHPAPFQLAAAALQGHHVAFAQHNAVLRGFGIKAKPIGRRLLLLGHLGEEAIASPGHDRRESVAEASDLGGDVCW